MNESKTVKVRNLTVGTTILFWGKPSTVTALDVDSRKDGYWITSDRHYRTHRWYRESVTIL